MKKMLAGLFNDILGIAGFGALCYGLYLVDPSLCFIIGGALVLIYAIKASRTRITDGG